MAANSKYPTSFFHLPVELQIEVLRNCTAGSLAAFIQTCPQASKVCKAQLHKILPDVMQKWPLQLQYLIRTVIALRLDLIDTDPYNMRSWFQEYLEPSSHSLKIHFPDECYNALEVVRLLHELTDGAEFMATLFVQHTLARAGPIFRSLPPECVDHTSIFDGPPLPVSDLEWYRVQRSIWRLFLYIELYTRRGRPKPLLPDPQQFFHRLTIWELDELETVHTFLHNLANYPLYEQGLPIVGTWTERCLVKAWLARTGINFLPPDRHFCWDLSYMLLLNPKPLPASSPSKIWEDVDEEANHPNFGGQYLMLTFVWRGWGRRYSRPSGSPGNTYQYIGFTIWDAGRFSAWGVDINRTDNRSAVQFMSPFSDGCMEWVERHGDAYRLSPRLFELWRTWPHYRGVIEGAGESASSKELDDTSYHRRCDWVHKVLVPLPTL